MLIDSLTDLTMILSFTGLLTYISPEACLSVLEYAHDEIIGLNIDSIIHRLDLGPFKNLLNAVTVDAKLKKSVILCRFKRKSSDYLYLDLKCKRYYLQSECCFILTARATVMSFASIQNIILPRSTNSKYLVDIFKITTEGVIIVSLHQ